MCQAVVPSSLSVLRLGLVPSNRCSVAPVELPAHEYSNFCLSLLSHLKDIKEALAQLIESQIEHDWSPSAAWSRLLEDNSHWVLLRDDEPIVNGGSTLKGSGSGGLEEDHFVSSGVIYSKGNQRASSSSLKMVSIIQWNWMRSAWWN